MSAPSLISIVITTYNRSDALLAVLRGLQAQTDPGFEVVVADDGSRPEHQQAILQSGVAQALRITHVWFPDEGFTAARARNTAVLHSKGDYVVLLDGDCVPERDFVARHRQLAQAGCFVNGSRVLLSAQLTQRVCAGELAVHGRSALFWLGQRLRGQASKLSGLLRLPDLRARLQPQFVWKGIRSCNMGVWRSDFERVDGFDESFVGWGHEDADFVLRLHHSGLVRKNGFCATEVFHLWHKEADRTREASNADEVTRRMQARVVRARLGMAHERGDKSGVVTRLG